MNTPIKTRAASLAAILAGSLAAVAAAQAAPALDAAAPPTKTVNFSDLNLDSPSGAKALYGRLHGAALAVCASLDSRDLGMKAAYRACVDQAIGNAVARVNNAAVTALHDDAVTRNHRG